MMYNAAHIAVTPSAAPICQINPDRAYSLGDGRQACYFNAACLGSEWFWSVATDTGYRIDNPFVDIGPYRSYADACHAALAQALNWLAECNIDVSDDEIEAVADNITFDDHFMRLGNDL